MAEVIIREYQEKDNDRVIDIYVNVLGIDKETSVNDVKLHQKSETSKIFVGVESDTDNVLGVVTFYWHKWDMVGQIGIIGVNGDAQGKGVGKKMCQKVFEFAKSIGVRKVYVDTSEENKAAQIFYIKTGFAFEYVMQDYYKEGVNGVMFSRKL